MSSRRRIKIAFICHDAGLYGAQKSLLSLLRQLDGDLYEAHALVPSDGPFVEILRELNIAFTIVEMHRWLPCASEWSRKLYGWRLLTLPLRVLRLAKLLKCINADIVYTNTIVNAEGAIAAKIIVKPHVWHIREGIVGNSEIRLWVPPWFVTRFVRLLSRKIIVNSAWLASTLFGPLNSSSVAVVHNGIDVEKMRRSYYEGQSLRDEYALQNGIFLVGIVGAIHRRKGHDTFVEAAALARGTNRPFKFVIIGDGMPNEKKIITDLAASLGVVNDLIFAGWRDDVASAIGGLDVVVVASTQEAFGRVGIEAMALGKPVISTRCGGPEEVIQDGITGYLVPIGDSQAIADKIILLSEDSELRNKLGRNGYNVALSHFSEAAYAENLINIIRIVSQGEHQCEL